MKIIQDEVKKENYNFFEVLDEKIREASKAMIERIYSEEVQDFLDRTALIVDEKGHRLVVRNGWNNSVIQLKFNFSSLQESRLHS